MEPVYDKSGQVVAWYEDGEIIDSAGRYIAFLNNDSIISYSGAGHLGWFENGVFWNSDFQAVGMLREHSASIPMPGLGGTPGRPGRGGKPGKPGIPGTPGRPGRSNSWSSKPWNECIV
jgi:hypothetical protein